MSFSHNIVRRTLDADDEDGMRMRQFVTVADAEEAHKASVLAKALGQCDVNSSAFEESSYRPDAGKR